MKFLHHQRIPVFMKLISGVQRISRILAPHTNKNEIIVNAIIAVKQKIYT
jgi:hypothetical protein